MKNLFLAFTFLLFAGASFAQNTFKQDVVKYLELSGQRKTFDMITKNAVTAVPADKQEAFKKDIDAATNELMNKLADIYMTEFTHDDIKAAIKFQESPVGKKLNSKTEVLYTKGEVAGQEWGMTIQEKMTKYMQ